MTNSKFEQNLKPESSDFTTTTVKNYSETIVIDLDHEIQEETQEYKYLVIFIALLLLIMELALM